MNNLSLSSHKLISTSMLSRPMVVSLTCSLLAHLTAFFFSYDWDISSKEKCDHPLLVELIDLPLKPETEHMVKWKDPDEKHGRKTGMSKKGVKDKIPSQVTYLTVKSNSPWTLPSEMENTNPSPFEAEATVSLDSQDLKYVSYLSEIKKKIEPKWHYPERAKKIGLQGKLALYFSIVRDGHLDRLKLLNSSGHSLLDKEALKAVRGAAPYYPLPKRLKITRLNILATFEYRISPYSMSSFSQSAKEESL